VPRRKLLAANTEPWDQMMRRTACRIVKLTVEKAGPCIAQKYEIAESVSAATSGMSGRQSTFRASRLQRQAGLRALVPSEDNQRPTIGTELGRQTFCVATCLTPRLLRALSRLPAVFVTAYVAADTSIRSAHVVLNQALAASTARRRTHVSAHTIR
jgi:hypothetical protein